MPYKTTLKTVQVKGKNLNKSANIDLGAFNRQVKKVVLKTAESKSYINSAFTHTGSSDVVHVSNLLGSMTSGTGEGQYDGEKMFVKNINLKACITYLSSHAGTNENSYMRILIIKTKQPITNTSLAGVTYTDIFRGSATAVATIGMVDLNKVHLIYDKLIKLPQSNLVTTQTQVSWSHNLRLNKNLTWDNQSSYHLKDGSYYIVTVPQNPGNNISTHFFRLQYTVNFKDV